MANLSVRDQIIVGVLAAILVTFGFYYFAWSPQTKQIAEIKDQIASVDAEIEKNSITLADHVQAKNEAPQVEEQLIDLETKIPSSPQLPQVVKQLTDLAHYSGMELSSLTVSPPSLGTGYTIITINMPMRGNYFDIIDFLYRAYYNPREFYVKTVTITPASGQYPLLDVAITGEMYSYLSSADAAAGTGYPVGKQTID